MPRPLGSRPFYFKHFGIILAVICAFISLIIFSVLDPHHVSDMVVHLARRLPGHHENPDIDRNIHQLIESRGFLPESHFITTSDGYILQTIRIVNPHLQDRSKLKPVLMFHGFQCSGSLWITASNGTLMNDGHYYEFDEHNNLVNGSITVGNTLGFVLASKGYDVWLANYRGSIYSSNHTTLNQNDEQFWSFSMDEMVNIDLPAIIDYITDLTHQSNIAYIGHSQGNWLMFSLLSTSAKHNQLVKPFIALSPVVYTTEMKTPCKHFQVLKSILRAYPRSFFHIDPVRIAYSHLCSNKYISNICFFIYSSFMGTYRKNVDMTRLGVYLANIPMGSSSHNAAHFFQMFEHGRPTRFDYGDVDRNLAVYGAETPPPYNMSNINSTDIALLYLKDDWFNPMPNLQQLKKELNVDLLADYQVPEESLNHMDMVWATKAGRYVNGKVLEILDQF